MRLLAPLLACAILASAAVAKPKYTVLGCSATEINADTEDAAECRMLQDSSIILGTTPYLFVCTSTGVYCCPQNASSAADCTPVSTARSAGGLAQSLQSLVRDGALRRN